MAYSIYRPTYIFGSNVSIDKVVIKGYQKTNKIASDTIFILDDFLQYKYRLPYWSFESVLDVQFRKDDNFAHYINNYNIHFLTDDGNENSFYIGCGFRNINTDYQSVKIEYNPNYFGSAPGLQDFIKIILDKLESYSIHQIDIAIDFPELRSNFCLLRSNAKIYQCIFKSRENWTEYLGVKHTSGRIKLYNKSLESGLLYPLTRLEITLLDDDINLDGYNNHFPDLHIIKNELSDYDRDRMLVYAILNNSLVLEQANQSNKHRYRKLVDNRDIPVYIPIPENFFDNLVRL